MAAYARRYALNTIAGDQEGLGKKDVLTNPTTSINIAEQLRKLMDESSVPYQNKHIHVTMSFGMSEILGHEKVNRFLVKLDGLLYKAKSLGRNTVVSSWALSKF